MQSGSMELTLQIMMVGAVVCLAAFFLGMPLTHSTQNPRKSMKNVLRFIVRVFSFTSGLAGMASGDPELGAALFGATASFNVVTWAQMKVADLAAKAAEEQRRKKYAGYAADLETVMANRIAHAEALTANPATAAQGVAMRSAMVKEDDPIASMLSYYKRCAWPDRGC